MSWDILPKSNLQYFLTKLKGIFDNKVDKETGKGLFSGSYNDLTNKPTIPAAANNNTITIQLNGVTVESFTLNQATDETINIQVTKSSVGLSNVGNFKAVSTEASQGLTDTEKSNARANIGAGTSSTDQQVYQENTNTDTDYRVLLGVENDITSYVYKSIGLRYNPGKDSVYTEKINNIILGDAIGYDAQNDSSASDLTNAYLPTGQTIKSYLNSNLAYKFISAHDIANSESTSTVTVSIPTTANEVYIEYGMKNSTQVYGGGAIVLIKNSQFGHPSIVPWYGNAGYLGSFYFFYNSNTVAIKLVSGSNGRVAVYYR